jgi:hypothetical protein
MRINLNNISKEDLLLITNYDPTLWEYFNVHPSICIIFDLSYVFVLITCSEEIVIRFSKITPIVQMKTEMGLSLDVIIKEFVDLIKQDYKNSNILKDINLHIIRLKAVDDEFPVYDLKEPYVTYVVDIVKILVDHIKADFDLKHTLIYQIEY